MRMRIRLLALAVVAIGGGTLASPREAHATDPEPPTQYCCCQVNEYNMCVNRCCGTLGCRVTADGCVVITRPTAS